MPTMSDRLRHAWNAFSGRDGPWDFQYKDLGLSSSYRPDRPMFTRGNEKSIVNSIYNRIAMDCASIEIQHVKLDANNRFIEVINSGLNNCLTMEANLDQTARAFKQDIYMSLMDEGSIAIVPVETDTNPTRTGSYTIDTMRVGKIITWYPENVKIRLYNDKIGLQDEIIMPKKSVAIIENPLYAVMNEQNSTVQRLIRKLNLLDAVDEQAGAGKLDLIIQLPYVVKTDARKKQADLRRKEIEEQLANSKYGVAYTDGTEKVVQLNRSLENNLMAQIEYLTTLMYSQLGITQAIMEGTASEQEMLNYENRTIEPIIASVVDEIKRKFLTKTARSQRQSIMSFKDPFKLVTVSNLAQSVDLFTRNEIMSSNEVRQIIGMKPALDPAADELRNKNMPLPEEGSVANTEAVPEEEMAEEPAAESVEEAPEEVDYTQDFDQIDSDIDELERMLNS